MGPRRHCANFSQACGEFGANPPNRCDRPAGADPAAATPLWCTRA